MSKQKRRKKKARLRRREPCVRYTRYAMVKSGPRMEATRTQPMSMVFDVEIYDDVDSRMMTVRIPMACKLDAMIDTLRATIKEMRKRYARVPEPSIFDLFDDTP